MADLLPKAILVLDIVQTVPGNGNTDVSVTRPYKVLDANCLCTASQTGGTTVVTVQRQALGAGSFNALSSAMACATISNIARTTTVTVAERILAATDVIRAAMSGETGGSTATGNTIIRVQPLPISGNG
jgi:hypothetical protein